MQTDTVIIPCLACGVKNRVPAPRLEEGPRCGKCGEALSVDMSATPLDVDDAAFDGEVLKAALPVLVDCWAPWCGPCRAVSPLVELLARQYQGRLKVVKVNVDENPGTGSRYSVSSIPSLLFFKGGVLVESLVGARSKEEMEAVIERIL
ncbi:MAG: thioredoxin [Desulfobacterales bacterium]|nr:thioredoxin [Desulfobacterales bacterium]